MRPGTAWGQRTVATAGAAAVATLEMGCRRVDEQPVLEVAVGLRWVLVGLVIRHVQTLPIP